MKSLCRTCVHWRWNCLNFNNVSCYINCCHDFLTGIWLDEDTYEDINMYCPWMVCINRIESGGAAANSSCLVNKFGIEHYMYIYTIIRFNVRIFHTFAPQLLYKTSRKKVYKSTQILIQLYWRCFSSFILKFVIIRKTKQRKTNIPPKTKAYNVILSYVRLTTSFQWRTGFNQTF